MLVQEVINVIRKGSGNIAADCWIDNTIGNYSKQQMIQIEGTSASDYAFITIDKDSKLAADAAGFSLSCDCYDGGIIFYCNNLPTEDILFKYLLL